VVADDEVHDVARSLALEMATGTSPLSQAISRRLLWSMLGADSPWAAHREESIHLHRAVMSDEARGAIAAFRAGSAPNFPPLSDAKVGRDWP
jgi:enoyl-CoA hydratase/carnithine racemase